MTCLQQTVRVQILTAPNEPILLFQTADPASMLRVIASAYDEHQALVVVSERRKSQRRYEGSLGTEAWGAWVSSLGVYLAV